MRTLFTHRWTLCFAAALAFLSFSAAAEKPAKVVAASSSGLFRVEQGDEGFGDVWLVSTTNPKQRTKIPPTGPHVDGELPSVDDEFHFSPDDQWIFGLHHVGSGLRDGDLFHRVGPAKIELLAEANPFSKQAWAKAAKLGAIKHDFSAEGLYVMTFFQGWSADSARLLVQLGGGKEKRSFKYGFVYYNVRAKRFELTDYLRRLSKLEETPLACAEPVDPLPELAELQKQFAAVDQKLNKVYQEKIGSAGKSADSNLRQDQRQWLKDRDAGVAIYAASATPEEKERRRLQFMVSVTSARIEAIEHPVE